MSNGYHIELTEKPTDEIWEISGGGIHAYNLRQAGPSEATNVCCGLKSPDGKIFGGLIGDIHWGWFYSNLLFLKEEMRGQGYGHQLLALAEEGARKRGATKVNGIHSVFKPRISTRNMVTRFLANWTTFRPGINATT